MNNEKELNNPYIGNCKFANEKEGFIGSKLSIIRGCTEDDLWCPINMICCKSYQEIVMED